MNYIFSVLIVGLYVHQYYFSRRILKQMADQETRLGEILNQIKAEQTAAKERGAAREARVTELLQALKDKDANTPASVDLSDEIALAEELLANEKTVNQEAEEAVAAIVSDAEASAPSDPPSGSGETNSTSTAEPTAEEVDTESGATDENRG